MKLKIEDFCIRCGICIDVCPELYEMDFEKDEIHIRFDDVSEDIMEKARKSIRDCAVGAIHFAK